jgi:hypothetical protein
VFPLKVSSEIQHDAGKEVEYKRKTDGKKRGINKKQAYLIYRNVEAFANVGTNAE